MKEKETTSTRENDTEHRQTDNAISPSVRLVTSKEYLSQLSVLNKQIDIDIEKIQQLQDLAMKCTTTYSDMPRSPTRRTDTFERTLAKLIDMENQVNEELEQCVDKRIDITNTIKKLESSDSRYLLESRYLLNHSWTRIAKDMGISKQRAYQIHVDALKDLENIFSEVE